MSVTASGALQAPDGVGLCLSQARSEEILAKDFSEIVEPIYRPRESDLRRKLRRAYRIMERSRRSLPDTSEPTALTSSVQADVPFSNSAVHARPVDPTDARESVSPFSFQGA